MIESNKIEYFKSILSMQTVTKRVSQTTRMENIT